jgi:hypothetical protein
LAAVVATLAVNVTDEPYGAVDEASAFTTVVVPAFCTTSEKDWVASGMIPFVAFRLRTYVLAVPLTGVPLSVAVPSLLSWKPIPVGREPDSEIPAVGVPVVVMVNEPLVPMVNVVLLPLMMVGGVPGVFHTTLTFVALKLPPELFEIEAPTVSVPLAELV